MGGHSDLSRLLEGTRTCIGDGGLTVCHHVEALQGQSSGRPQKKIFVCS